jgi:hypothetical protein
MILKKLGSKKDLRLILSEFSLGLSIEELTLFYNEATKNPLDFLLIDLDAPDDKKFRKGFRRILRLS